MPKMIFVNLPVENVARSREFFSALGYTFNEQFSDEKASCMVVSDTIFAMLLSRDFFKQFIKTEISDSKKVTEVLIALSAESREEVDALMTKALAAGGSEPMPARDLGFMYNRTFVDLDGHHWEIFWMAAPQPS